MHCKPAALVVTFGRRLKLICTLGETLAAADLPVTKKERQEND